MREIIFKPNIYKYDGCGQFVEEFNVGKGDLILTNQYIFEPFFGDMCTEADVIYQERYGKGEPSEEMFEAIAKDAEAMGHHSRVIGIGGGSILDMSKLLSLKCCMPAYDLYMKKIEAVRDKQLVLVPTTCGTGSEVTNISVLAFPSRNTKIGLAVEALYADTAVLIPELMKGLPFPVFATSSIDALIHAIESSLSPKATAYTKLFGHRAIEMILKGYMRIAGEGHDAVKELLDDFAIASNFAGLAFGTAGCGAVHAMSYPLSGTFHTAHGEANYAMFMGVMKYYYQNSPEGELDKLTEFISGILGCGKEACFDELESLFDKIIVRKTLSEYGADSDMIKEWADSVIKNQQRLMVNAYIPMDCEAVLGIYKKLL